MLVDDTTVIAFDFDGTITERDCFPHGTAPIRDGMADVIRGLRERGIWTVLWTCREGAALDEALDMCRKAGIEFDSINEGDGRRPDGRKVNADVYVDDRSLTLEQVSRRYLHE